MNNIRSMQGTFLSTFLQNKDTQTYILKIFGMDCMQRMRKCKYCVFLITTKKNQMYCTHVKNGQKWIKT